MDAAKIETLIQQSGFMPLFTTGDAEVGRGVLKASYDAGVRLFEFTNRTDNSFEVFKAMKAYCEKELPEMILGIGTIKNKKQAEQYIAAGAAFMISPLILPEIQEAAVKHNVLWLPGCATPTDIGTAENWGINTVKIFPARQLGGPAYIKAVKSVYPKLKFLATGGVEPTKEDIASWFKGGVTGVGIGSQLFPEEWLKEKQFDKVTEHVKNIVTYINIAKALK